MRHLTVAALTMLSVLTAVTAVSADVAYPDPIRSGSPVMILIIGVEVIIIVLILRMIRKKR